MYVDVLLCNSALQLPDPNKRLLL